jgi:hypothetical protein
MTYHATGGDLLPTVVGFDYQRTMVAAAVAMLGRAALARAVAVKGERGQKRIRLSQAGGIDDTRRLLLVGLGAGSCAAACAALLASEQVRIDAVENDPRVVDAAEEVHGVCILRHGSASAVTSTNGKTPAGQCKGTSMPTVSVTLCDAADYVNALPSSSMYCVMLDAYDAKGRVPWHIQAEPFIVALGSCLAPGGCVIANLWNGTAAARAEADAFVARLARSARVDVFALRVVGHEKNRILVAIRASASKGMSKAGSSCSKSGPSKGTMRDELRQRLQQAADSHREAHTEAPMVKSMYANASTLEPWGGATLNDPN